MLVYLQYININWSPKLTDKLSLHNASDENIVFFFYLLVQHQLGHLTSRRITYLLLLEGSLACLWFWLSELFSFLFYGIWAHIYIHILILNLFALCSIISWLHMYRRNKIARKLVFVLKMFDLLHKSCNNCSLKRKATIMNKRESIIMEVKSNIPIRTCQTIGKY